MPRTIHFIAGLPRSGSTLLSALLKQNPRLTAGMSSPVAALCGSVHQKMSQGEFSVFFDEPRRAAMLRGIFDAYYAEISSDRVVIDTNRSWTGKVPLLATLFPACRIICCVRGVGWILDSIERLRARNPLQISKMFSAQTGATVYTRAEALMHSQKGLVGSAWSTLREAWFAEEASRLIVIRYESLARRPEQILGRLYDELGEPSFKHDFDHVSHEERDYDTHLGMPGLHTVRSKVGYEERAPRIPPDLFAKYEKTNFWDQPELNLRGVTLL